MSKRWLAADEMIDWLRGEGGSVSSGDVYARLRSDAAGEGESAVVAAGGGADPDAGGSNDG